MSVQNYIDAVAITQSPLDIMLLLQHLRGRISSIVHPDSVEHPAYSSKNIEQEQYLCCELLHGPCRSDHRTGIFSTLWIVDTVQFH